MRRRTHGRLGCRSRTDAKSTKWCAVTTPPDGPCTSSTSSTRIRDGSYTMLYSTGGSAAEICGVADQMHPQVLPPDGPDAQVKSCFAANFKGGLGIYWEPSKARHLVALGVVGFA